MLGAGDCESIRVDALLAQPVNTISALAFVAVGAWLLRRRPLLGAATAAVGVGSFLFHGPQPPGARWFHDTSIVLLLVAVAAGGRLVPTISIGGAAAALLAFAPDAVVPLFAAAGIAAAVSAVLAARGDLERLRLPALVAGAGLVAAGLGGTGGPLCDPDGILQLHAVWHVLAAIAMGAWGRSEALGNRRFSY